MLIKFKKILILVTFLAFSNASSAELVIKLATVAPKDSIWHEHLKIIDQRWQTATDGQVKLRIYAGIC